VDPPGQKFIGTSALNKGPQEQFAGQDSMVSDASSRATLQHPLSDAGYDHSGSDTVTPENRGGSAGVDEGPNEIPHAGPKATLQDPLSHAGDNRPKPRTDLQSTLYRRNGSRVVASNEESGELSIRKLDFAISQTGVGSDPNCGSGGNDEGEHRSKTRQDGPKASGMLLTSTLPISTLLRLSNEDLGSAGDNLQGGGGGTSNLDLPNTGDGATPKQEPTRYTEKPIQLVNSIRTRLWGASRYFSGTS